MKMTKRMIAQAQRMWAARLQSPKRTSVTQGICTASKSLRSILNARLAHVPGNRRVSRNRNYRSAGPVRGTGEYSRMTGLSFERGGFETGAVGTTKARSP